MARPKSPLISVDAVVAAAVELLAAEGYPNFSLRNLAARLQVNAASIYHHFVNKDEILMAAVRFCLRDIVLPPMGEDWHAFMCESSVRYRRLLVARPFLLPIMLGGIRPTTAAYAAVEEKLGAAGIPPEWRPEILHTLDNTVVASAAVSINAPGFNEGRTETHFDHEELLRAVLLLLIREMEKQFAARNPALPAG